MEMWQQVICGWVQIDLGTIKLREPTVLRKDFAHQIWEVQVLWKLAGICIFKSSTPIHPIGVLI